MKTLPSKAQIAKFAEEFPELQPETIAATVRLLKAASLITCRVESLLAKHGLSQAKFVALMILNRGPEHRLRPVEIASAMGISKKNTSRLLDAMAENGLIRLESHESDRRSYRVETSKKGIALLRKVLPKYYRTLNLSMRALGEMQKKEISRSMDLVIEEFTNPSDEFM